MATDPDIITARQVAAACTGCGTPRWREFCLAGAYDTGAEVQTALMGIKVGRGLEPLSAVDLERIAA